MARLSLRYFLSPQAAPRLDVHKFSVISHNYSSAGSVETFAFQHKIPSLHCYIHPNCVVLLHISLKLTCLPGCG